MTNVQRTVEQSVEQDFPIYSTDCGSPHYFFNQLESAKSAYGFKGYFTMNWVMGTLACFSMIFSSSLYRWRGTPHLCSKIRKGKILATDWLVNRGSDCCILLIFIEVITT